MTDDRKKRILLVCYIMAGCIGLIGLIMYITDTTTSGSFGGRYGMRYQLLNGWQVMLIGYLLAVVAFLYNKRSKKNAKSGFAARFRNASVAMLQHSPELNELAEEGGNRYFR